MPKRERKNELLVKFLQNFDKHDQCILIRVDNINSDIIHTLRLELEKNDCVLMFMKNSLARKALQMRSEESDKVDSVVHHLYKDGKANKEGWEKLSQEFREVNGCIFTNGKMGLVSDLIEEHTLSSNGYAGYVSDIDVIVPEGPTSIDIKMTNFFQKQNIPTKVQNKKILIEKAVTLLSPGDIVNGTHLKIIELLGLCPFKFKVQIKCVWDKGNLLSKHVLSVKDEDTLANLFAGVANMNALSLETGIATEASVSHSISRLVKGLANVALTANVEAHQLETLVGFLKDPSKMLSASGPAKTETKQEEKKEEKKVEEEVAEDVDLGGGLFGDDEEEDW